MSFELHPNLRQKSFVVDLPLSSVLLEDNVHYPWLFLVPRRAGMSRIMDLTAEDQLQLMVELDQAQRVMWEQFKPAQLNVAAIGNKTPQLHVHVIARQLNDPAWPGTVWDHPVRAPYNQTDKEQVIALLRSSLALV